MHLGRRHRSAEHWGLPSPQRVLLLLAPVQPRTSCCGHLEGWTRGWKKGHFFSLRFSTFQINKSIFWKGYRKKKCYLPSDIAGAWSLITNNLSQPMTKWMHYDFNFCSWSCGTADSSHLQCQHPTRVSAGAQAAPFLLQVLVKLPEKAAKAHPSMGPCSHAGELAETPGSWLRPGVATIWGVSRQIEDFSVWMSVCVCNSAFQINEFYI